MFAPNEALVRISRLASTAKSLRNFIVHHDKFHANDNLVLIADSNHSPSYREEVLSFILNRFEEEKSCFALIRDVNFVTQHYQFGINDISEEDLEELRLIKRAFLLFLKTILYHIESGIEFLSRFLSICLWRNRNLIKRSNNRKLLICRKKSLDSEDGNISVFNIQKSVANEWSLNTNYNKLELNHGNKDKYKKT